LGVAQSGSSRRAGKSDAPASRSHAHLHPQSHPFAHKTSTNDIAAIGDGGLDANAPALRLRGLPFTVSVQDVLAFFAQHDVADKIADQPNAAQLLQKANGRPSGQAVVQMRSRQDAEVAQQALCNQWVGGRYIEVFVYGGEEASRGIKSSCSSTSAALPIQLAAAGQSQTHTAAANWGGNTTMPWPGGIPWGTGGIPGGLVPGAPAGGPPAGGKGGGTDDFDGLFQFLYDAPPDVVGNTPFMGMPHGLGGYPDVTTGQATSEPAVVPKSTAAAPSPTPKPTVQV